MTIQPAVFKRALSQFASGVTVVTTRCHGENYGMTASAFSSVSLDPPLVLVCVATHARSHAFIKESGAFAVNVLGVNQRDWGMRFAGMQPEIEDRFAGINYSTAVTNSPILPDTLSWLDCRLRNAYEGGDHTIFVGEVVASDASNQDAPLLYYNRDWRELAQPEPVLTP